MVRDEIRKYRNLGEFSQKIGISRTVFSKDKGIRDGQLDNMNMNTFITFVNYFGVSPMEFFSGCDNQVRESTDAEVELISTQRELIDMQRDKIRQLQAEIDNVKGGFGKLYHEACERCFFGRKPNEKLIYD